MQDLNTYVLQARQQGQTDEQIRQALLAAGWDAGQVDAALLANTPSVTTPLAEPVAAAQQPVPVDATAPTTPQPAASPLGIQANPKSQSKLKLPLIILGIVVILGLAGAAAFSLLGGKQQTYQQVAAQFVTAVQKGDKTTADSLESPAMKSQGQKFLKDPSFYDACKQEAQLCISFFSDAYISKATVSYKDYTSGTGVKGKQVIYAAQTGTSTGQSCSGSGKSNLSISLVPSGKSWLVDSADPNFSVSAKC